MILSYQLYSSRDGGSLGDTLSMLAAVGYRDVEGYGALLSKPDDLKAELARHGFRMRSCHVGLDQLRSDMAGTLEIANSVGLTKIFAPYLPAEHRPNTVDGWVTLAEELAELGQPIREAGIDFGWHNHDFELDNGLDGTCPLEIFADKGIRFELDLGWVARVGQDPAAWIHRLGPQISAVHLKDLAPHGTTTEDGWADVGHGILDWPRIKRALDTAGIDHLIVEHDAPSDDVRFARRAFKAVQAWMGTS